MIVPPGRRRPSRSAASIMRMATRSLIDPPGLKYSTFATSCGARPSPMRLRRISGVSPTVSRIESLMSEEVPVVAGMAATIGARRTRNCRNLRMVSPSGPASSCVNGLNAQTALSGEGSRVAALRDSAGDGARRVEAMVTRHGPALLRVANQFSLCHDDALDAYQRALEIYLRRLDSVERATEGAWMRVVVKHEAMAIRRARAQSVDRDDVDLDANVHAGAREVE